MKKQICFLVILVMAIYIMVFARAAPVSAEGREDVWEGGGVTDDPYLISSYEDLSSLRDMVNDGDSLQGVFFKQTADISFPDGENWIPIGDLSGHIFAGTYNGDGYTLSNINSNNQYAGLFSFLGGEVRNLGIESGSFHGTCAGSITSHGTETARIINCYNKADVYADGRAGGITDNYPGLIMFCWNSGHVEGAGESVVTAGITSYGSADIRYCYAVEAEKLTDDGTFSGTISDSGIVALREAGSCMELFYQNLFQQYITDKEKEEKLITRGNTVFMVWKESGVCFDSTYEPDIFRQEREEKKQEFLTLSEKKYSFDGKGTKEDPFLISSCEDLACLRDCVNIGVNYAGYFFEQTQDLYFPDGENWKPIGDVKKGIIFNGTYDGQGHCIYNVSCEDRYAGIFALLGGEVRNLGIESGLFRGECIGSITSHGGGNARIINCYNKAKVRGKYRAGGLADNFAGEILYCLNLGDVSVSGKEGIAASISSYGSGMITSCFSTGDVMLVNPRTFTGEITESELISKSETADTVKGIYRTVPDYEEEAGKETGELIYIASSGDGQIRFGPGYIPEYIKYNQLFLRAPWFALAILCVLSAAAALRNLYLRSGKLAVLPGSWVNRQAGAKEYNNNQSDEALTYDRTEYAKRAVSCMLCAALLLTAIYVAYYTLRNKNSDGITTMQNYYLQEKGSVDVLLVGSSRTGINLDGGILWDEFGISAYNLWGNTSPVWNSYYFMKEALKINPPKVVVFEVSSMRFQDEFSGYQQQMTNTSGLKNGLIKLEAIAASCSMEDRLDFILQFPLFHGRYWELSENDFMHYNWSGELEFDKGSAPLYGRADAQMNTGADCIDYLAVGEKQEYYLKKIIRLCRENNIPLVFVSTQPMNVDGQQPYFHTVSLIAEAYGVPFINFTDLDRELNFSRRDFYKDNAHLNVYGARKDSAYLGAYLRERYALTDHRGDADYREWDVAMAKLSDRLLQSISDKDDYLDELAQGKVSCLAIPYGTEDDDSENYEELMDALEQLDTLTWMEEETAGDREKVEEVTLGARKIRVMRGYSGCEITIQGKEESKLESKVAAGVGIILVAYNKVTDTVVDITVFSRMDDYQITHINLSEKSAL